jgi:hypothetical protein
MVSNEDWTSPNSAEVERFLGALSGLKTFEELCDRIGKPDGTFEVESPATFRSSLQLDPVWQHIYRAVMQTADLLVFEDAEGNISCFYASKFKRNGGAIPSDQS